MTDILKPLFQPVAGSLTAQPPTTSSSQTPPLHSWTTVTYKQGRSTQEFSNRVAKHVKANCHLSPSTITSNRYTSLANEDSEAPPTPTGPATISEPIPIQNVISIPLIQLLNQTANQQYVITALANNQVWVQPTISDSIHSSRTTITNTAHPTWNHIRSNHKAKYLHSYPTRY
jgi:hypothetical protein